MIRLTEPDCPALGAAVKPADVKAPSAAPVLGPAKPELAKPELVNQSS